MHKRFSVLTCAVIVVALLGGLSVPAQSTRVVTNKDLENARQKREASEVEYEKRRRELGLPSRAQEQAERQRELEAMQRVTLEQEENEANFRLRAMSLREEIAAVEAQINYWSIQINNADTRVNQPAFVTIAPGFYQPYVYLPPGNQIGNQTLYSTRYNSRLSQRNLPATATPRTIVSNTISSNVGNSNISSASVINSNVAASNGSITRQETYTTSGIGIRARIGGRRSNVRFGYNRRQVHYGANFPSYYPFGASIYGAPFGANTNNEQLTLSARERLRELYATRAALLARFQVLEDDARRAGIAPGVLR